MKVFIIGAGTMGSGIAQVFASKGFQTFLCDIDEKLVDMGYGTIENSLGRLVKKEVINETEKNNILNNIIKTTDRNNAKDCQLVVEAVIENIEIKKALFKEIELIADKDTILATNTSSLSITEIAASLKDPGRLWECIFLIRRL